MATASLETQFEKILEKFKELKKEAATDTVINRDDIFDVFNTKILMKWINKRTEWTRLHRIYEESRKIRFKELFEYYRTEFHLKLTTKDEYQLYIESDTNYTLINNLSLTVKEIIQYIDSVIETIKSRQWEIKNIIAWRQFQNGQ